MSLTTLDSLMFNLDFTFTDRKEKVKRLSNYLQQFQKILTENNQDKKFQKLNYQYAKVLSEFDQFISLKNLVDLIRTDNPDLTFADLDEANQKLIKEYYQNAAKVIQELSKLEYMAEPLGATVLRVIGGVIGFILGAVIGGLIFHIAFGGPLSPTGLAGGAVGLTGGGHFGLGLGVTIARDAFQVFSGVSNIFGGRKSVTLLQKQYYEMKDHGGLFFKRKNIENMDYYALVRNAANEILELLRDDAEQQLKLPVFDRFKMHMGW